MSNSALAVATQVSMALANIGGRVRALPLAQNLELSPTSSGMPGAELFQKLLNWLMQWGIWLAAGAFVIGAGMWAVGALSATPQMAARGQKAIAVSIVAAMLLGAAKALFTLFYQAGGAV